MAWEWCRESGLDFRVHGLGVLQSFWLRLQGSLFRSVAGFLVSGSAGFMV